MPAPVRFRVTARPLVSAVALLLFRVERAWRLAPGSKPSVPSEPCSSQSPKQLAACDAADDVENATGGKLEALGVNVVSSARLV